MGVTHDPDGELVDRFLDALPFEPTHAQRRTIEEMFGDLRARAPMHRLLQGDVGAGKTIVAVAGLLAAVQGGHQGALMAPTEVLAEQHFASIREMLEGLEVDIDPSQSQGSLDDDTAAGHRSALQPHNCGRTAQDRCRSSRGPH